MPRTKELPRLQVLLIETEDCWIAQGIQHDISVEADTLTDLLYELNRAMVGHYCMSLSRDVEPFKNMPPARSECVELWKSGYKAIFDTPSFQLAEEAQREPRAPELDLRIASAPLRDTTARVAAQPS